MGPPTAPRLLLDANVFRDLADGALASFEQRLLRVAEYRSPPLLWICPIAFDEIASHVRAEEADEFAHLRDALRWADRLCSDVAVAEDLVWILRRGVFASVPPYDSRRLVAMNGVRRELIEFDRFADVPPNLVTRIKQRRAETTERINAWNERRREMQKVVRAEPRLDPKLVVAHSVSETLRKAAEADRPAWGEFRSEDEQRRELRELAGFEVSHLMKAQNPQPYNVDNYRSDYHDGWLLAYLAAGYHLVTGDGRLRKALLMAGCDDPRVLNVGEGLDLAEAWVATAGRSTR